MKSPSRFVSLIVIQLRSIRMTRAHARAAERGTRCGRSRALVGGLLYTYVGGVGVCVCGAVWSLGWLPARVTRCPLHLHCIGLHRAALARAHARTSAKNCIRTKITNVGCVPEGYPYGAWGRPYNTLVTP